MGHSERMFTEIVGHLDVVEFFVPLLMCLLVVGCFLLLSAFPSLILSECL